MITKTVPKTDCFNKYISQTYINLFSDLVIEIESNQRWVVSVGLGLFKIG